MWVNSSSMQVVFVDPLCYRYCLDDDEKLVSNITSSELPIDFPLPCICQKFAEDIVCPCRVKSISCCEYYKCVKTICKNPGTVVLPGLSYSVLCFNNLRTSQTIAHIYFVIFEQLRQLL